MGAELAELERLTARLNERDDELRAISTRVLLVDDDCGFREYLASTLTALKYEVLEADRACEAIEHLSERCFGVGVFDLRLPGRDGLELAAVAREICPSMPIILLTGFPSEATAIQAVNRGVFRFVVKGELYDTCMPELLDAVSGATARWNRG